ncbi:MAG: PIN domain-containing protein [Candidatus Hadarchaeales archaeon]
MRRGYIDANIFDYMALKHPTYGKACKQITDDIRDGEIEAYCSFLVPVEILGSLAEIDPRIVAGAIRAFFTFSLKLIPIDEGILTDAARLAPKTGLGHDAIHAASALRAGVKEVMAENHKHWSL